MATTGVLLSPEVLARLIPLLNDRGYQVMGPVLRDGAVIHEPIESLDELPAGFTAQTAPGTYRAVKRGDGLLFAYNVGPHSLKTHLHPAEVRLVEAQRNNGTFRILNHVPPPPRRAYLGVRACDLAAVARQDRILLGDRYVDTVYQERRREAFFVAVNCTEAASTCFCASMGTGPRAESGYDIVLTELTGPHEFLAEAGSAAGQEVLDALETRPADGEALARVSAAIAGAEAQERTVETQGLVQALCDNFEHPRWEQVAGRCLSCTNCTMVCPTCFCITVDDNSDVAVEHAERWRRWDSCFTQNFSYIHGGSVRQSARSRYRQWLTHKFGSWVDQFGDFGCVGCGRCIAWCPAAIDVTEEVAAITSRTTA